ncbi:hypothetical protein BDZ89DRAFT_911310, partial [Hymenopellis radicata]
QERDNLDKSSWIRRTWAEHAERVKAWCMAETGEERQTLYEAHHVRYSELLRLPYWDPTTFVTLDSMHAFYLGLFHRHTRVIWGM